MLVRVLVIKKDRKRRHFHFVPFSCENSRYTARQGLGTQHFTPCPLPVLHTRG